MSTVQARSQGPLVPYPEQKQGEDGQRGKRPSEKKVEAKDISKILSPGVAVAQRVAQPRGMLWGGGGGDYIMRGTVDFKKTLTWTAAEGANPGSSLVRSSIYPLGPLNEISEDSISTSLSTPNPVGVPISVDAIYRGKGAFTFYQTAMIQAAFAAGGSDFLIHFESDLFSNSTGGSTPPGYVTVGLDISNSATPGAGVIGRTGVILLEVTTRLTPVPPSAIGSNGVTTYTIQYYTSIKATYGTAAVNSGAAPSASGGAAIVSYRIATGYLNVTDATQRLWLDLNVWAARDKGASDNMYCLYSQGSTIGGHDGSPYDFDLSA